MMKTLIALVALIVAVFATQESRIVTTYDKSKNVTTLVLPQTRIASDAGVYHSLDLSVTYSYEGSTRPEPKAVELELVSVVKLKRLNSDLYVEFLINGEAIHFSSNRSAIRNPVPGRTWVGERMVFRIPYEDFKKLASAEKLGIRMGSSSFELTADQRNLLRELLASIAPQQ
jgi:hypothetical protein